MIKNEGEIKKNIDGLLQREKYLKGFKDIDRRALSKMKDKELAEWQSGYPPGTPQHIVAEHEWQSRLTVKQVRGAQFAAFMGVIGTIVGSLITWLLTK